MPEPIETIYVDLGLKSDTFKKQVTEEMNNAVQNINKAGQGAQQASQQFISMKASLASSTKEAIGFGQVLSSTFQSVMSNIFLGGSPLNALIGGIQTANAGFQGLAASGSAFGGALAAVSGPVGLLATGLATVVGAGMGVVGVFERIAARGEAPFAALAARVETLGVGLDVIAKNAGVSLGVVREKMQGLQATGITTRESIESLMQFLSQDLPIDGIEKLARAGQDIAVAYGKNSTETFNRFVYAIMTGNAEVLRLVGINKTATMMQTEFAQSVNKSANELTDLERKQAIVNGIIKAASGYTGLYEKSMESLGKRIGSLPRYLEEAKLAFEQTLVPMLEVVVKLTEDFWKSMQRVFVVMTKVKDESGKLKDVPLVDAFGGYKLTEFGQQLYDLSQTIANGILPVGEAFISWIKDLGSNLERFQGFVRPIIDVTAAIADLIVSLSSAAASGAGNLAEGLFRIVQIKQGYDTSMYDESSQAWEAFKKAGMLAIYSVMYGITMLTEAIKNANAVLAGESTTSWNQWAEVATEAAQSVLRGMLDIPDAVKVAVEETEKERENLQKVYKVATGEPAFKESAVKGEAPVETKEFKEWLAEQTAAYEEEYGVSLERATKARAEYEAALRKEYEATVGKGMVFEEKVPGAAPFDKEKALEEIKAFDEWIRKQEEYKPPKIKDIEAPSLSEYVMSKMTVDQKALEEDARTAAMRTKFQTDAIKKFADMMDAAAKSVENAEKNFKEAGDRFNEQVKEQEGRLLESLNKALARLQKDYAKRVVDLRQQADESEKEVTKQAAEARVEAQKEIQDRQTKIKQDFLFQMKRMEEDYLLNLEDAVGARDARKVLELMRQHKINQTRAKEDFDRRNADQTESDQKTLTGIDKREQEVKNRIKESLNKQLVDLKTNLAEREDELRENYNEQLRELNKNADKQRTEMKKNYDKNLADLKKANNDRMIEMIKGWADANIITASQANIMLQNLDAFYGAKGSITVLLNDFIERVRRNANINIVITATTSGELTGPAAVAGAEPVIPVGGNRRRATGGLTIADRPTIVEFGEGGREANFSIPMGPGDWTIPQLQNMGRGKGEDRMTLDVRIRADSNFSPQFEDGLYGRLADTIMKAAGQRIRITKG